MDLPWSITTIAAAPDGLILTGHTDAGFGGVFTSPDGRTWKRTNDAATERVIRDADLITGSGEQLTAFVYEDDRVRLYRAQGVESWKPIGELPQSRGASVSSAAVGPVGWVALGDDRGSIGWTSPDGVNWQLAPTAPTIGGVVAMFGVDAGFVALTMYDPGAIGCAVSDESHTVTWTSADGRIWRLGQDIDNSTRIQSLRRRGRTLIGIGIARHDEGAVWTARLPPAASDGGPTPSPTFVETGPGCGG
jgi:hypothetical protein